MSGNPLNDAMDDVEDEQDHEQRTRGNDGYDVEGFLDSLAGGEKDKTIGIAVTEKQRRVWRELQKPADQGGTDTDLAQSVRNLIDKHAHRNEEATERAAKKYEIDKE